MSAEPSESIIESAAPVSEPAAIGTPSQPTSWRDSLSADLKNNPTLEQIPDIETLAKNHVNVQKLIGVDKIPRPKDDWTPEQYEEHYTRLGRPAKAEDYDLGAVEIPEGLPLDEAFQGDMVGTMHKLGLTNQQVAGVLGAYYESVGGQYNALNVDNQQTREAGVQDLKNEWGRSFDAQVDLAQRAIKAGAGEKYNDLAGIKLADGRMLGDHPDVIRAFAALGNKMSEHGLVGAQKSRSTLSPQEAGGARNKLMGDQEFLSAYTNSEHPEHDAAVAKMQALTEMEVGTEIQ